MLKRFLILACLGVLLTAPAGAAADSAKSVTVFVALADNLNQRIVPVPSRLGNGDDARNNLYWGALYGLKTFLSKSPRWRREGCRPGPAPQVLETCRFRHHTGVGLLAHAYRGRHIKKAMRDFLAAASHPAGKGAKRLVVYLGHNGLMDMSINPVTPRPGPGRSQAIVLACISRPYWAPLLKKAGARALLLTTGLMAPEAYTLEAALESWIAGQTPEQVRRAAAGAYHAYQRCGMRAAMRLLVNGD